MPTIFLDIDGVLIIRPATQTIFDYECVRRVHQLCEETGASIILSSDWRYNWTPEDLATRIHGETSYNLPIISATPTTVLDEETGLHLPDIRGKEIAAYLEKHPATNYVILDDLPPINFLTEQHPHLVTTDFPTGFTSEAFIKAKTILTKK